MNLQAHLEDLRAKPEHIRKRYAFWGSFGITAIIFAFWLGSFSVNMSGASRAVVAQAVNNAGTPAQSLVASVGSFFGDVKDMMFGPRKVTYSTVEVRAGKK
jgi:hypothetical protein